MSEGPVWPPETREVVLGTTAHPNHNPEASLNSAMVVDLLQEGDRVLWAGRSQPATVDQRRKDKEQRYDDGETLTYFRLEGNRGGQYRVTNYQFWGGEGYSPSDPKGVYPQIRRISGSRSSSNLEAHLSDGFGIVEGGPWVASEPSDHHLTQRDVEWVVFERPVPDPDFSMDGKHVGHVVDWEFGQPIVEMGTPIDADERTGSVRQSVDPSRVTAYRTGGVDSGE